MQKSKGTQRAENGQNALGVRERVSEMVLRAVRAYTFNTPISRGRHRAYLSALKIVRELPGGLIAPLRDGRRFSIDLATGMQTTVYFLGEYEKTITEIVEGFLKQASKQASSVYRRRRQFRLVHIVVS
ncbi:MAG: hypothetical protein ABI791_14255 [Acidobacteriota bacterium]